MGNGRHVATDVTSSIIDSRVEQREEGRFYELPSTKIHQSRVFASYAEFDWIEGVQFFEECTGVSENLS